MLSQLKKITDDRGMLLLYLADELSPGDRQVVEQRLASQPALAAQLADLRTSHAVYMDVMATLDAATPPPVPELAAMQRANRVIRQWATRRLAHPAAPIAPRPLIPRWWYPVAAAAVVIVSITVWGVRHNQDAWEQHQRDDTPEFAIQNLRYDEQQNLVDAVVDTDSIKPASAAELANQAVASLQNSDDLSLFLDMGSSSGSASGNGEGTR